MALIDQDKCRLHRGNEQSSECNKEQERGLPRPLPRKSSEIPGMKMKTAGVFFCLSSFLSVRGLGCGHGSDSDSAGPDLGRGALKRERAGTTNSSPFLSSSLLPVVPASVPVSDHISQGRPCHDVVTNIPISQSVACDHKGFNFHHAFCPSQAPLHAGTWWTEHPPSGTSQIVCLVVTSTTSVSTSWLTQVIWPQLM